MPREKSTSNLIDDALQQAQSKFNILKTQTQTATLNLQDLEKRRNKLSEEIIVLEKNKETTIKETQEEKDRILKLAQEKLDRTSLRDAETSGRVAELDQKQKEAEDIVKSNQGLQKNLNIQREDIQEKYKKLAKLTEIISETLQLL